MVILVATLMKIYSWNMLFRNKEADRALAFIVGSDFDIFCLQEVPEGLLAKLKTLSFHVAYRSDMVKFFSFGSVPTYNVILSRHPIQNTGEIPYPEYLQIAPLRTRIFFYVMRPFYFSKVVDRGGLYSDILVNERTVRVFNLHLILGHPKLRLEEFEKAMVSHDATLPTIVCGDFNIVESPHITILNWLLGGRVSDALFYKRERRHMQQAFSNRALHNPHYGEITHSLSRSQLDHILASNTFSLKNSGVSRDRYGSDHAPIWVELA